MEAYQDFKDLFTLFNEHSVEYIIVGAYALAFHGAPRFTGDLDILIRPTRENGIKIIRALTEYGFVFSNLTAEDFIKPDNIIQLGVTPIRVDLLTSITGITWDEAESGQEPGFYGDIRVNYIGRNEFIINKKASGRKKDLADLEAIGEE